MMELHIQRKRAPVLMDIDIDHARRLLSRLRFSKRLTVSRTTALMAMLTRTQMKALYSSLVRHTGRPSSKWSPYSWGYSR